MSKGQLEVPSQLMINALSFVLLTVAIVGTLIHLQQYQVTYQSRTDYRQNIDFAENLLSSNCTAYVENGRVFRGMLDMNKLNQWSSTCIHTALSYTVQVVDENKDSWNFGTAPVAASNFVEIIYPVVIKHGNIQTSGQMVVTTYAQ